MHAIRNKSKTMLAVMLLSCAGCQSLLQTSTSVNTNPVDVIAVQIRPAYGKAKNTEIAITPNMWLQDVVDQTKTSFRHKQAYIVRTSPDTGETHKLECQFGSNGRISLQTDYAIQPGDRVVISQDTATSFDRVMQSLLGRS